MKVYKTVNICRRNLTDKFVSEDAINEMAKDGWTLMNITVPPVANNNFYVIGVFVRDEVKVQAPKEIETVVPVEEIKRGPGRPRKEELEAARG